MTILMDECVPASWAPALSAHGHLVHRWLQVGPAGADDEQVLAWARSNAALVLTCDNDLGQRLWFSGQTSPTVLQLGAPTWLPDAYLSPVLLALDECAARSASCFFVRIMATRGSYRLYALPLG